MKTENDLPQAPPSEAPEEPVSGLFTDRAGDGDGSLLSTFDGSETPVEPVIEPPAGAKPFRLKLENGHYITGATEAELLEKLVKGKNEADKAILDRENQIRQLKTAPPTTNVPGTRTLTVVPPAPVPDGAYSDQTYLDLLGKDTIAARRYQDQYIYNGMNPVEALTQAHSIAQNIQQRSVAADFMQRNTDYTPTSENSNRLLAVVAAAGLQPNLVNMEWAFGEMKRTGVYSAAPAQNATEYQDYVFGAPKPPPAPPQRSRGAAAPPAPRSGPPTQVPEPINAETMPLEKLREELRKKGALSF